MSLICDAHNKFLLDKWGIEDIRLHDDFKTKADSTALWEIVPSTSDVEALAKWFVVKMVDNPTDSTRRFKVYHSREGSAPEDPDYEIEIRLQGVLSSFNFARGGNWSGANGDRCKAKQFVELQDFGSTEAWQAQSQTLADLRYYVLRNVPGGHAATVPRELGPRKRLFVNRRAFTKQWESGVGSRKALPRWVFSDSPQFFKRSQNGELEHATHEEFQIGDFVDVVATLEIVTLKDKAQVHLTLQSVTLLKDQARLKLHAKPDTSSEATASSGSSMPMRHGRARVAKSAGSAQPQHPDDTDMQS